MTQRDVHVMYLVEKDINLSPGKGRAQCAHASHKIAEDYFADYFLGLQKFTKEFQAYEKWADEQYTKIVLKCPIDKWETLKNLPEKKVLIRDAGYTEIEPGTETVIGFWPMLKSEAPEEIKKLRLF